MKYLNQALILIMLSFSLSAFAADSNTEYGLSFQMENQIENRILNVVRSFDNSAQVLVKVKLATMKTSLPGANVDYEGTLGLSDIQSISQDQIAKVEVKVLTKASRFPPALEQLVKEQIGLPTSKYSLAIDKMEPEVVSQIESENPQNILGRKIEAIFEKNHNETRLGFLLAFCLGIAFFVLQFVNANKLKNIVEKAAQDFQSKSIHNELDSGNRFSNRTIDVGPASSQPLQLGSQHSSQDDSINELPLTALLALFTDCYWTKEDGYAAWLWQQLSASQRVNILKGWDVSNEYIQFLSQIPAKPDVSHHHPYYLSAFELTNVSQEDLSLWMQDHAYLWKMISPMRQACLPISIFQKIEWSSLEKPANVEFIAPKVKSIRRALSNASAFGSITELDELKVLENPKIIPDSIRSKVPTLAWLALENLENRTRILSDYSASELAQAWVGHKMILEKLQEALPEAKFKLLESYLKNVNPSRNSPIYGALLASVESQPEAERIAA